MIPVKDIPTGAQYRLLLARGCVVIGDKMYTPKEIRKGLTPKNKGTNENES